MKKRGLAITALTMSALMTFGTGAAVYAASDVSSAAESGAASASSAVEAAADEKPLKVALLLTGNLGDMSFLDSANEGMKEVEKKHNVTCQVIEMGSDSSKYEGNFLDASDEGYDIIIGSGWQSQEPIQNVAPDYPDTKYILFDASVDYDKGDYSNVYSINYKQNEGSFLAGVMAGEMTETNTIGFLGGMQGSVIDDFMLGYIQGAQYANKDIKVLTGYVNSYSDSATCKEMSLADYNQGNADVVFTAAGASGVGTLDAAKETGKWAIGVDSDQAMLYKDSDPEKANHIPASVMKRVDNSLVRAFDLNAEGKLPWGKSETLGLADGAVGLSENEFYEKLVPENVRADIEDASKKIVSGEITVDTAFGKTNDEIAKIVSKVQ